MLWLTSVLWSSPFKSGPKFVMGQAISKEAKKDSKLVQNSRSRMHFSLRISNVLEKGFCKKLGTTIEKEGIAVKTNLQNLISLNPSNANTTKSSNTVKSFVGKLLKNCLSVSDHFVWLALKELRESKFSLNMKGSFTRLYSNKLLGRIRTFHCRTQSVFGHTSIYSYHVLEWNWRALAEVGCLFSNMFRI